MSDIFRDGVLHKLDQLDELEEQAAEKKRKREPQKKAYKAPGLGKPKNPIQFLSPQATSSIVLKLKPKFRRWAEFIEEAEDSSDSERRTSVVRKDIRSLCGTDKEAEAVFKSLREFLSERIEAAHDKSALPSDLVMAGDVGDLE